MSNQAMRYKAKSVEVILRWALVLSICLFTAQSAIAEEAKTTPPIKGQVTFLYYADMDKAAHFYGEIMGFENTFDEEWVKFFAITPTSSVGLVDESRGFHQTSDVKPVMLSVETDDVESWYNYLKKKDVNFIKHLDKSKSKGFVHAILVEDPGGYTVEVFEWK